MLQEHTTAVLMLCAIIPGDRTNVHVNMVILEMEELAKVSLVISIYSRIAPFFALNRIFFPANEKATLKTTLPIRFQGFFKENNQIAGK